MHKHVLICISLIISPCILTACASSSVKRVKVEETIDLSGRWNDTDARFVAKAMIDDCLNRPWHEDFIEKNKRKPVVIVGSVANNSHEHINADVFTKDLERSLINSWKVKFVASPNERLEIREEREDQQQGDTNPQTIKRRRMETGADFMLIGSINSIKDETKGRYVILYQVNLELVDIENNEKVWIGQHLLKKVVKQNKYSL